MIRYIFSIVILLGSGHNADAFTQSMGLAKLPWKMEGQTKVFLLKAEKILTTFCDEMTSGKCRPVQSWGYNGSMPGPTIEVIEGDHVRIQFENQLTMPTAVHWHGLELPNSMDGGGMHTQKLVKPGETFNYEFTVEQSGTFMYHSGHMQALQVGMGMGGFFIAHPREDPDPVDIDVPMMLQIWSLPPYSQIPDTMSMNFNWFTINGKVAPFVPHIRAISGQKIRVRIANLSMMSHPIHLHGHTFKVVETGAGRNPDPAHWNANTLSINAGETRTIEFEASKWPGPWLFHCHFMHHIMNDMDMPPIPGDMNPMMAEEGMFTIVDVVEK